ncbi:MAG: NAD-dependent succinate-semialdehyde dehydrogenase [Acidimicrobiaceae bacterium]|nr:NAD-dependent succinate-semialdehyde dehydrogenase [Acidimicrobiaceae bacterium]MCY4280407.1 NAD-dependent succinate-semialdehyde dehydrogenase [Acidimicrobiaceae bacterium]MCY4294345.1 NAD-dependent succinate-semialdehyde dehydrogenase [Acidimicrobiaceae bacterium]
MLAQMQTRMLIDGDWTEGAASERFEVVDPATGEGIAEVAAGTAADALAACDAAEAAQRKWAAAAPRERSEILRACYQTLLEHSSEIAELITREHGKPQADALGEVAYSAEFFRWNAEEAVRVHGSVSLAPSGDKRIITRHPPVGVVAMVTPWNFPAAMIARKVAPALAAGNATVIKPARDTPLTALRLAQLLEEAGVPPGLVNVVPTRSSGAWFDAVVDHRAVRMVSFTGSTEVGRTLLRRCADRVLKVCMELGGNAPFVVFADADLDAAVAGAMVAKMRHSAEVCTAANRFFVEAPVAEEFTERFAESMAAVRVGNGFEPGVTCGPMINPGAVDSIDALVQDALGHGARKVNGGGPVDGPGFFYEPTVLADVDASSPITRSEIFGPVAPVIAFDDTNAMIAAANDTEMGLIGYVYTGDLAKGLHVSERIEAGMVGINRGAVSDPAAPFGGMKQSGLGREGASEGIYEFCETQYIAADW